MAIIYLYFICGILSLIFMQKVDYSHHEISNIEISNDNPQEYANSIDYLGDYLSCVQYVSYASNFSVYWQVTISHIANNQITSFHLYR